MTSVLTEVLNTFERGMRFHILSYRQQDTELSLLASGCSTRMNSNECVLAERKWPSGNEKCLRECSFGEAIVGMTTYKSFKCKRKARDKDEK